MKKIHCAARPIGDEYALHTIHVPIERDPHLPGDIEAGLAALGADTQAPIKQRPFAPEKIAIGIFGRLVHGATGTARVQQP